MAQITATFYQFAKRENSTLKPASGTGTNIVITFKEQTDFINPTIEVHYTGAFLFNYCYIDFTGRYYFVRSPETIAKDTYLMNLECDVLASHIDAVRGQNVYAAMSSYAYDTLLDDERVSALPNFTRDKKYAESFSIIEAPTPTSNNVYQFMSVMTNTGKLNGIDVFFGLGNTLVNDFMKQCADRNWLQQVFGGITGSSPIDAINDLWWSPLIPQNCHDVTTNNGFLYDIQMTGNVIASPNVKKHHTTIEVPKPSVSDFRYSDKYVKYYLELPYIGVQTIPTELLRDRSAIEIAYAGDCLTGQMTIAPRVGNVNLGIFGTSLKSPLAVAKQQSHTAQVVTQGAIGAGAMKVLAGAAANPAGIVLAGYAAGVARGIATMPEIDKAGSAVGSIAPFGCRDTIGNCALCMIEAESNINPATLAAIAGRPTEKVTTIQNGFIQARNASVAFAGTSDEIRQFNSLLNGGIYVE